MPISASREPSDACAAEDSFFRPIACFQRCLRFPQISFPLLNQSHQKRGFEMSRRLFENLSDTFLGVRIFFRLKINLGQQQSEFAICRFVFESGFQEMDAFGAAVGDEQVV